MKSEQTEADAAASASAALSASDSRPLRLGIVGCMSARARYASALTELPEIEVAALADTDRQIARAWARQMGGKRLVFDSLDALLAETPALDAVLIASPLRDRAAHIHAVAQAGKAMLCALPFALSLGDTDTALRVAAEQNALLLPALPRRFDVGLERMAEEAASGKLGILRMARCDWSFPLLNEREVETEADGDGSSWRALLVRMACQTADLCRWWLGDALAVSADIDLPPKGARPNNALANIIVTHERGQSVHQLARARSTQPDERYKLIGAQAHLERIVAAGVAGPEGHPSLTLHRGDHRPQILDVPEEVESEEAATIRNRRLLAHFADCVRVGCAPRVSGMDARAALEIVQAAYLSTREGTKVSLPLRYVPTPSALPPPSERDA